MQSKIVRLGGQSEIAWRIAVLLGNGVVLRYILRNPANQAVGSVESGSIKRGLHGLIVRDQYGGVIEELSGSRIRSWNVVGPDGASIDNEMTPGDFDRLF
jgi:hypothetical protein